DRERGLPAPEPVVIPAADEIEIRLDPKMGDWLVAKPEAETAHPCVMGAAAAEERPLEMERQPPLVPARVRLARRVHRNGWRLLGMRRLHHHDRWRRLVHNDRRLRRGGLGLDRPLALSRRERLEGLHRLPRGGGGLGLRIRAEPAAGGAVWAPLCRL